MIKNVIEIPVFSANTALADAVFGDKYSEYPQFRFLEYHIDDERSIFFYLLNNVPQVADELFLDQIIQMAPFSFLVVDPLEEIRQSATGEICRMYFEQFETPMFFIVLTNDEELKNNFENEPLVAENNIKIILADPEGKDILKSVLKEAFNQIIPQAQ
ncbi:MAG: hypothetical protein KDF60_02440 [Calditrichaeota bacterium]|nr:hypothetical protein [Calditrichota bacterium]